MEHTVRTVRSIVATLVLTLAASAAAAAFEIWALDQGTNVLYVITPDLEVGETIALPAGIDMPHMIAFSSDQAYAFVANVASGNTAVIRASDREVVALLDTGAGTHSAVVVPGDRRVVVDVIGEAKLVEIVVDIAQERFEIGRELVLADDPLIRARSDEFPSTNPICHDYTADGRFAYITLGPALANAGLVVLDVETFELVRVFPGSEIATNCGTIASPDGRHVFLNGGSVDEGVWYVFDAETHEMVHQASSRGTDAHGVYFTNDGSELWMVNRHSSNGIVIDPVTFDVIDEIAFTGRSPDIMTIGLDDAYAFVTLRGPQPRSGPHAIHGDTPGVAVIDVATRALVTVLEPDRGNPASDFHGIALRRLGD